MFAAVIDHFGGPEVISGHALPVPPVDANEVMIAVDTAGVGPWDANVREGYFASRKPRFRWFSVTTAPTSLQPSARASAG